MTTILAWLRLDKNSSTPARCWTLGAGRVHGKRLAKAEGRRRRRVAGHDSGAREGRLERTLGVFLALLAPCPQAPWRGGRGEGGDAELEPQQGDHGRIMRSAGSGVHSTQPLEQAPESYRGQRQHHPRLCLEGPGARGGSRGGGRGPLAFACTARTLSSGQSPPGLMCSRRRPRWAAACGRWLPVRSVSRADPFGQRAQR